MNPRWDENPLFYRELPDRIQIWPVLHGARDLQQELNA